MKDKGCVSGKLLLNIDLIYMTDNRAQRHRIANGVGAKLQSEARASDDLQGPRIAGGHRDKMPGLPYIM